MKKYEICSLLHLHRDRVARSNSQKSACLQVNVIYVCQPFSTTNQVFACAGRLEIKRVAEGTHHLPGVVEATVHSIEDVWNVLQTGSRARVVGCTNANKHSSRSHW